MLELRIASSTAARTRLPELLARRRPCRRAVACRDAAAAAVAPDAPAALVDRVLQMVDGTDGGIRMTEAQRAEVDALLDRLEELGAAQRPRPLENELLFGNYSVAYVSTSRAPTERGQPAGGRFRGSVGRALFRTTGVFQSVLQPDEATNKVAFKLFGLLPGAVGLRGKVVPVPAGAPHGAGAAGEGDTVKVLFEPPVLSLGGSASVHLRIGPPSSVQLSTTYLDERVRLGKGSRGSLFVFTRGGAADQAGMDRVGREPTTRSGLSWLFAAMAAMAGGGWALWSTGVAALRVLAGGLWLLTALLAVVLQSGGIIRGEDDIQRVAEMQAAAAEKAAAAVAAAGSEQQQQQQQLLPPEGAAAPGPQQPAGVAAGASPA